MDPIAPNPHSPHATADPNTRHMIPSFIFAAPVPGVLALTGCNRLAVVPSEPLQTAGEEAAFPPGMCDDCIAAWHAVQRGEELADDRPLTDCTSCESPTRHGKLCALCAQDAHDEWRGVQGATGGAS
ncbi:hypothetical protein ACFQ6Q_00640 [Streptomyces sp. NPDC056437]|uniref:hypothetical protein n=1 Tax=Streptomyces sp. NPDC056437 TaxID=3345816 RepID=UPI0036C1FE90